MCDTFVVLPDKSFNGSVIFGKNSDRDPNEPHQVQLIEAKEHPSGQEVQCTYRSIPQAKSTHQVLLFKPVWIWGAEMGINEHGVVIGNEAVFSKVKASAQPGLTGMDYLRLGLERASTAFTGTLLADSGPMTIGQDDGQVGRFFAPTSWNSFLSMEFPRLYPVRESIRQRCPKSTCRASPRLPFLYIGQGAAPATGQIRHPSDW